MYILADGQVLHGQVAYRAAMAHGNAKGGKRGKGKTNGRRQRRNQGGGGRGRGGGRKGGSRGKRGAGAGQREEAARPRSGGPRTVRPDIQSMADF